MALFALALLSPSTTFLVVALVVLVTLWLFGSSGKPSLKQPPGPRQLPFIGNLHEINLRRQDLAYMKLSEKYGPVFKVRFGPENVVVMTGYDAVKEALTTQGNDFIDKPLTPIYVQIQHGNGVIFSSGEVWKTTRRFTLTVMRDLGMGKNRIEERILDELRFLSEMIDSYKGEPFKIRSFIGAPANITFYMLFGTRFDYDDPNFVALTNIIHDISTLLGVGPLLIYNIYPFLGFFLKPHKMILEKVEIARAVLRQKLEESKLHVSPDRTQTFIDRMTFKQHEENSKETDEKKKIFYDENVLASVIDLALAGTETTNSTLQWAVLLMIKHPEIQQKVQEEIKTVLGDRLPTYEDRKQMHFCNAVIHEVQRFTTLLPQMPRAAAVDTVFRGYFIPKGTTVIPSLTSVLYDKTQWETPLRFNPNHFLDAKGIFVKKEAFMPFSIGRRSCAGETLARMELFLFFVGLLQKYTFQPPPGVNREDLDLSPVVAFILRPQAMSICAMPCN